MPIKNPTTPTANRDLPSLDWSAHADPSRWPIAEHLYLAEAALIVGEAICEPWDGRELQWGSLQDAPLIPYVDIAFVDDKPVANVHDTWGSTVRSIISAAEFAEGELRKDEAAWLASHVADPVGGLPIPSLLLRARNGDDADDPITPLHWEIAFLEATERHHFLRAARTAMPPIARAVAELAFKGEIETFIRPIGGATGMLQLEAEMWGIDDPMPRLASCSMNKDRPFDIEAEPTHLIFVEERSLRRAMPGLAKRVQIALISELEGGDWRLSVDIYETTITELTDELNRLMELPACAHWTKLTFLDHAETMFGSRAGGVVFEHAWRDATAKHPSFSKPGRRVGT